MIQKMVEKFSVVAFSGFIGLFVYEIYYRVSKSLDQFNVNYPFDSTAATVGAVSAIVIGVITNWLISDRTSESK